MPKRGIIFFFMAQALEHKIAGTLVDPREKRAVRMLDRVFGKAENVGDIPKERGLLGGVDVGSTLKGNLGDGIIRKRQQDKVFYTKHDPMREVFGSAEISNPKQIEKIKEKLNSLGVKLIQPEEEKMCYSPSLCPGNPGVVTISKGASYSAWLHEFKHVIDDYNDGWLGFRVFQNPQKCVQREIDAYEIEINLAKLHNRADIVKRLEVLRDDEIKKMRNN